jgi:hypothetical protein
MTRPAARLPRSIWTNPKGKIEVHKNVDHHAGHLRARRLSGVVR